MSIVSIENFKQRIERFIALFPDKVHVFPNLNWAFSTEYYQHEHIFPLYYGQVKEIWHSHCRATYTCYPIGVFNGAKQVRYDNTIYLEMPEIVDTYYFLGHMAHEGYISNICIVKNRFSSELDDWYMDIMRAYCGENFVNIKFKHCETGEIFKIKPKKLA